MNWKPIWPPAMLTHEHINIHKIKDETFLRYTLIILVPAIHPPTYLYIYIQPLTRRTRPGQKTNRQTDGQNRRRKRAKDEHTSRESHFSISSPPIFFFVGDVIYFPDMWSKTEKYNF